MPLTVQPTKADHAIADFVARNTSEPAESFSQALTWAADEHVLCAVAAGWWLFCRFQAPQQQQISNHLLLTAVTTAIVPHLLKQHINQRRPDRVTIRAHLHGVPISGKARDAFPSGHAIHMGALASAACRLPTAQRNTIWALSGGLVLTRVILLAHWATDVAAGLAIGAVLERALRPITGFGIRRDYWALAIADHPSSSVSNSCRACK